MALSLIYWRDLNRILHVFFLHDFNMVYPSNWGFSVSIFPSNSGTQSTLMYRPLLGDVFVVNHAIPSGSRQGPASNMMISHIYDAYFCTSMYVFHTPCEWCIEYHVLNGVPSPCLINFLKFWLFNSQLCHITVIFCWLLYVSSSCLMDLPPVLTFNKNMVHGQISMFDH